jgi:hypothetical protein
VRKGIFIQVWGEGHRVHICPNKDSCFGRGAKFWRSRASSMRAGMPIGGHDKRSRTRAGAAQPRYVVEADRRGAARVDEAVQRSPSALPSKAPTSTLHADTQPFIAQPREDEVLNLSITGNDVGKDVAGEFTIGSSRRRSYFPTERGLKASNT